MADDRFKPDDLEGLWERMKATWKPPIAQPQFSQSEALIALRMAEVAVGRKSSEEVDHEMETAQSKVRNALLQTPSDAFLWLLLYSIEMARNGVDATNMSYLDQSYATGPNEGWIALRRNRMALASFPMLSEVIQSIVVSEFAKLVDSDFAEDAAMNLTTVGWSQRAHLLNGLGGVDITSKRNLVKRLAASGINVEIPSVDYGDRPWR